MSVKTLLQDAPDDERIAWAVREMRTVTYNETQEQFANRLDATIRTITRYETSRPPRGDALVRLWKMARKKGLAEIADIFSRAFMRDFWNTLTDVGFMEKVYEDMRAAIEKHLETELRPKLREQIILDLAARNVDAHLTEDEHLFVASALAIYRASDPARRQLLADFPGIVRRASWMLELEEKIRRAEKLGDNAAFPVGSEPPSERT